MLLVHLGWAFVHVPRTGGSSIRHALERIGGVRGGLRKHVPAREIRRLYPDIMMFGFVRNPWDRLVSLYSYLAQNERTSKLYGGRLSGTFRAWLMADRMVDASQRGFWGDLPPPRQPQSWWLDGCDEIGRFERLPAAFHKIMRKVGRRTVLHRSNRSHHGDYRQYYDDETRQAVAEWHAADIERWGYVF